MKRHSGPRPADTERTPTHTYRFPAPRNHLDVPSLFPGFSLWSPEPQVPAAGSPGRRGFENHQPKNRSHIQNFSVNPLSTCVVYPQHTTHILAFAFPSCYHDCPVHLYTGSCLRLFDLPFPISWCTELWNPAPEFPGLTLFRFGGFTLIR